MYRKHSMYPGGLKETPYKDMQARNPDEVCIAIVGFAFPLDVTYGFFADYTTRGVGNVTEKQTS